MEWSCWFKLSLKIPNRSICVMSSEPARIVEEGAIHRDLVGGVGARLSLSFWIMDGFFYALAASEPERLDEYLDSLDLAPAIEEPISSV